MIVRTPAFSSPWRFSGRTGVAAKSLRGGLVRKRQPAHRRRGGDRFDEQRRLLRGLGILLIDGGRDGAAQILEQTGLPAASAAARASAAAASSFAAAAA